MGGTPMRRGCSGGGVGSVPDVDDEGEFLHFAVEEIGVGGDGFDVDVGVAVEPFVDLVVEVFHALVGEAAMEGFDAADALAGDMGGAFP